MKNRQWKIENLWFDRENDDTKDKKLGNSSCGCCITASKNIYMKNEKIVNIISQDAKANTTKEINSDINNS